MTTKATRQSLRHIMEAERLAMLLSCELWLHVPTGVVNDPLQRERVMDVGNKIHEALARRMYEDIGYDHIAGPSEGFPRCKLDTSAAERFRGCPVLVVNVYGFVIRNTEEELQEAKWDLVTRRREYLKLAQTLLGDLFCEAESVTDRFSVGNSQPLPASRIGG